MAIVRRRSRSRQRVMYQPRTRSTLTIQSGIGLARSGNGWRRKRSSGATRSETLLSPEGALQGTTTSAAEGEQAAQDRKRLQRVMIAARYPSRTPANATDALPLKHAPRNEPCARQASRGTDLLPVPKTWLARYRREANIPRQLSRRGCHVTAHAAAPGERRIRQPADPLPISAALALGLDDGICCSKTSGPARWKEPNGCRLAGTRDHRRSAETVPRPLPTV
jgi:hypothetical protein